MADAMFFTPAWFVDNAGTMIFVLVVLFVAYYYYSKKKGKAVSEKMRIEKSIDENGIILHHAKEIIDNYGHHSFLNKTPAEIENTVNEYNDLFKARFSEQEIVKIAHDIYKEVNG